AAGRAVSWLSRIQHSCVACSLSSSWRRARHRTRAIPRAHESPCATSRTPCSRAGTRRLSAADPSERVWTDDFPAVALAECPALVGIHRARTIQELLDVAAGASGGVEKQDSAGFAAGVPPGVRDVVREERAGTGATDGDLVADLEGDLAGEHP